MEDEAHMPAIPHPKPVRRASGDSQSAWNEHQADVGDMVWRPAGPTGRILAQNQRKDVGDTAIRSYGLLDAALPMSLEFLDSISSSVENGVHEPLSCRETHLALCVLRKRDWMP